ncbi:MAG: HlyC/CorC family transporter [Atopobiaceae bacterium]|nr:HlyC/CorC family transporter [Atopobiaceae bacterium]
MDILVSVLVTLLLTIANGFFSMAEMALTTAKRAVLEPEADEGDKRARRALDLASDSGEFLAAIQVAITLVGFAASAFAATSLSEPFSMWMMAIGVPAATARILAPVIITLIVSYFSIVVGELVPKRIALANAEEVAKDVAGFLGAFSVLARPLVWLTSSSANAIASLMGIESADDRQAASEEEIRYMVTDADDLSEEEKSMIHEIFELGDAIAREVMVPRVDVTFVEDTDTCSKVLSVMRHTGFSRLPVFHEDLDNIVGVAHIKDLIAPIVDEGKGDELISLHMREADFVPETKDIISLLSEMQASRDQMVIVVDEYGGTTGVITMEDIVEEVVGEIEDEFDPDNKYLTQLSDREWLVDGRYSIDDAVEMGWPVEENEGWETIAGFVLNLADSLPEPGDSFEVDGYRFRVQSVRGQRVAMLRITAPVPDADGDGDE